MRSGHGDEHQVVHEMPQLQAVEQSGHRAGDDRDIELVLRQMPHQIADEPLRH